MGYSTHDSSSDINLKDRKKKLIDRETFKKVMLSKCNVEPYLHLNLSKSVVQSDLQGDGKAGFGSRVLQVVKGRKIPRR